MVSFKGNLKKQNQISREIENIQPVYFKELRENLNGVKLGNKYEGCTILGIREHDKSKDLSTTITAEASSVAIPFVIEIRTPLGEDLEVTVMTKKVVTQEAQHEAEILEYLDSKITDLLYYKLVGSLDLTDGYSYILTELIPNAVPIAKLTKLSVANQEKIVKNLGIALAKLHKLGIIHSDPHGNNFLISAFMIEGLPEDSFWCIDFGLSQIVNKVREIQGEDELESALDDLFEAWRIDVEEGFILGDLANEAYYEELGA